MLAENKDANHKLAVTHFLAEHGADANAQNADHLTPSQLLQQLGKEQVTQLLFKAINANNVENCQAAIEVVPMSTLKTNLAICHCTQRWSCSVTRKKFSHCRPIA